MELEQFQSGAPPFLAQLFSLIVYRNSPNCPPQLSTTISLIVLLNCPPQFPLLSSMKIHHNSPNCPLQLYQLVPPSNWIEIWSLINPPFKPRETGN